MIGSKDATRSAFKNGLIGHGEDWMKMIEARNLSLHTYNLETAQEIADDIIGRFYPAFEEMAETFAQLSEQVDGE